MPLRRCGWRAERRRWANRRRMAISFCSFRCVWRRFLASLRTAGDNTASARFTTAAHGSARGCPPTAAATRPGGVRSLNVPPDAPVRPPRRAFLCLQACSSLKGLDGAGRSNSTGCASPGSRCRSGARPEGKVGLGSRRGGEKAKGSVAGVSAAPTKGPSASGNRISRGSPPPSGRTARRRRGALISAAICRGQSSFGSVGGNPNALARS